LSSDILERSIVKRDCNQFRIVPITRGSLYEVNNKHCLSSNKEKNYAIFDSTCTDYEVDKMAKGYYQAIL
jgi:hypothetical protein